MGIIRSQAQWQNIFEDQKTSGLTIIGYCREHQLPTATFYAARKKLALAPSKFVRAKFTQQVELIASAPVIELSIGQTKITLPLTTTASYLGQVLRELT